MGYAIAALVGALVFFFFRWARKKGAYYNQADQALRRLQIDPSIIDQKHGRGKYHATLEFMLKQGLSPDDAAAAIAADLNGEYHPVFERINGAQDK